MDSVQCQNSNLKMEPIFSRFRRGCMVPKFSTPYVESSPVSETPDFKKAVFVF